MNTVIRLLLLVAAARGAAAVFHSLKYIYTASSGVPNLPEFVVVGLVDDVPVVHYDSNTRRAEPKQDWMKKVTEEHPQYWNQETEDFMIHQQVYRDDIEILKKRFNQTGGIHIFQWMYGCDWDDETGEVTGYEQYGYNGEDFIALDLKTETWIAPKPQAVITKHKWDHNRVRMEYDKYYYTQICPEWGKKYVAFGRSYLLRTELPSVTLLQKTPSSPVSCHATGFYPSMAALFWRRDEEELHEEVEHGEILPNPDGTFQMSVDLNLSSVSPGDWRRYDCVFQLSGVDDDIITKLDRDQIWTNWEEPIDPITPVGVIASLLILIIIALVVLAVLLIRFKGSKKRPVASCPSPIGSSKRLKPGAKETNKAVKFPPDGGSEFSEMLKPEKPTNTPEHSLLFRFALAQGLVSPHFPIGTGNSLVTHHVMN